VTDMRSTASEY